MWKLSPGERIAHWKNFRKSLDTMPIDTAILAVAEFWQSCPYVAYYLDPDTPDQWPTPWELILENYYCDLAKALGIVYTIHFSQHSTNLNLNPQIHIYNDTESGYVYNLSVFAQGKYVVNFIDNTVVNIESINKKLKLKHCYNGKELKL